MERSSGTLACRVCDAVLRVNRPLDSAGRCKGFAWITFKSAVGRDKAIEYNGESYAGQTLFVERSGQHRKAEAHGFEIFVKNFPYETEEAELLALFEHCGPVKRLNMPTNKKGGHGRCMGFAWLTFETEKAMKKACKMTGEDAPSLAGRRLFIEKAGQHK